MASAPTSRHRHGSVTTFANPTTTAATEIVAAAGAGIKIRVVSAFVQATADNTVTFRSAATAITGGNKCLEGGGYVLPLNEDGWFETAANEALNVTLSAATPVAVLINYRLSQV